MSSDNIFGDVIYFYSRKQAIEDGILVDLSEISSIKNHWEYPFACTAAVWEVIEEAGAKNGNVFALCDEISFAAKLAGICTSGEDQVYFHVSIGAHLHELKLHIGPGDTSAPVLTLMFPHED